MRSIWYLLDTIKFSIPALLLITFVHEYPHGIVARMLGDDTGERAGRLKLNPFNHLDPVGSVAFVLFGYGWTRPIPVNKWKFKHPTRDTLIVALSGPAANILVGIGLYLLYFKLRPFVSTNGYTANFILKSAQWSVGYGLFNLFPIPPMDGAKIMLALIPEEYMGWYAKYEVYGILLAVILIVLRIPAFLMHPVTLLLHEITSRIAGG
ncbi:MAG TPA: site-2 protease family protein [Thermotogae bacterium]|nr:site-2 protease family protein [Thermotogota bacterium]